MTATSYIVDLVHTFGEVALALIFFFAIGFVVVAGTIITEHLRGRQDEPMPADRRRQDSRRFPAT